MSRNNLAIGITAMIALTMAVVPTVTAEKPDRAVRETIKTQVAAQTTERKAELKATAETKRAEIQAKLDEMKQNRVQKLDEKRLGACEKREAKINAIIQKRSEQGTKHLEVFRKISDRVQTFVADKNLTIDNYAGLVAAIEVKEAAVEAAIEANTANTFDCEAVDATAPVKMPRTSIDAVRDALKDYRSAIKDLIVKVKSNNATQSQSDDASTAPEEDTTTTPETTEGGTQ